MKLKKKFIRRRGVSLVDALVAMAIFGIVSVALFGGISLGFSTVSSTRQELRANQILLEKMEAIRLYSWDQINTPGFIPTNYTAHYYPASLDKETRKGSGLQYQGTVTISDGPTGHSYSSEVRTITATISWKSGDRTINRNISTFVTRGGLQRYIY